MRVSFGSHQCKLCKGWFHYSEDKPVCRACYLKFKWLEIYDRENEVFEIQQGPRSGSGAADVSARPTLAAAEEEE